MKKLVFALSLCLGSIAAFAQNTTEVRNVGDFTGIRTSSPVMVELTQGETNSVTLEGDSMFFRNTQTDVNGGTLSIRSNGRGADGEGKVRVTVKNLKSLDASGAASVTSTNEITTDTLSILGAGAANVTLNVHANKTKVNAAGASNVRLGGTTDNLSIEASGASHVKAYSLAAETADVSCNGAATAHVTANKTLNATASGAAEIHYQGAATERNINATGGSSISMRGGDNSDTTRVRISGHDVLITESGDEEVSHREKKANDEDFQFWDGFDFGVNGLLTAQNQVEMPAGFEFLELNYARSYMFSWNAYQKNIHIYRNNVNLGTGIGLSWYHYNFRNSYTLQPNVSFASAIQDSLHYRRNRLGMTYINVPLFLEFNTNNKDARNSFHFGAGMEFGYNIFNNVLKQKYELNDKIYKNKIKDDFNVNPFRYDIIARIGYGNFTIYGQYSLSTLFAKNKGPVVYPFSAGIHIDLGH